MTLRFNKYHESLLKRWSSMAKTYSIMHSSAAQYYSNLDKRLAIPVILLGATTASSIFSSGETVSRTWIYINGGMALVMTGLSGISKFLGTHEKQVKHTSASFKYIQISMNIDTVLSFPRNEREENPRQFINDIKTSILEVREHSPDIPTGIVDTYIKRMDKTITNTSTRVNKKKGIIYTSPQDTCSPSETPSVQEQSVRDVISPQKLNYNDNKYEDNKYNDNKYEDNKYNNDNKYEDNKYNDNKYEDNKYNNDEEKKHIVVLHHDSYNTNNYIKTYSRDHTSIEIPDFDDNQTNTICIISNKLEREESDSELQSEEEEEE